MSLACHQIGDRPGRPAVEPDDSLAFRREPIQTAALVLEALLLKEIQFGIVVNRARPLAVGCSQFQSRQMVAGQMADQVGSTQDQLTFESLHV